MADRRSLPAYSQHCASLPRLRPVLATTAASALLLVSCGPSEDPCCSLSPEGDVPWSLGRVEPGEAVSGTVRLRADHAQVLTALRITDDTWDRFELGTAPGASVAAGAEVSVSVRFTGGNQIGAHGAVLVLEGASRAGTGEVGSTRVPVVVEVVPLGDGEDSDGDALSDRRESVLGTSASDADSDDDGLLDGEEGDGDADGDLVVAPLDPDDDGDAILDGTEAGRSLPGEGTNPAFFVPDSDPATVTDPRRPDSDGDGLSDGREDLNHDGAVGVDELDANSDDSDGDTLLDGLEAPDFPVDPCPFAGDADSDEDGLNDAGAGDPDPCRFDTDGDVLGDGLELGRFAAGEHTASPPFVPDGSPSTMTDPRVVDTDGGGAADGLEDIDHDGVHDPGERDPLDPGDDLLGDSDGDGVQDDVELSLGLAPGDADSDDDSLPDGSDGLTDHDGDGRIDALDADSDGDAIPDSVEAGATTTGADTDAAAGNFFPDLDPATTTDPDVADSDGDLVSDGAEDQDHDGSRAADESDAGAPDTDLDGLGDGVEDADHDGRRDPDESSPVLADTDSDGLWDAVELVLGTDPLLDDSDADGLLDGEEDPDGDGFDVGETDPLVFDTDGDSLSDGLELGFGPPNTPDLDSDSVTDPLLPDTDGGGLEDGVEDADGNGRVDAGESDPLDAADDQRFDADGDGAPSAAFGGGDCNDVDGSVFPGAVERCDLQDSDCDTDLVDGFADADTDSIPDCAEDDLDGDSVPNGADCGPYDATVHPGAPESCDGVDSDCDGSLVDGAPDLDADLQPDCIDPDDDGDLVSDALDCGPLDPAAAPGSPESCDSVDHDCDGDYVDGFANTDGDGLPDCVDPDDDEDGAADHLDCAPLDPAIHPGVIEVANDGVDQDCDGADLRFCHPDLDGDGAGAGPAQANAAGRCLAAGWSITADDCDDNDATRHPRQGERCNARDDDCDATTWAAGGEVDRDLDGFLPCPAFAFTDSGVIAPSGGPYLGGGDCLDDGIAGPWVHPARPEVCDGWDSDCSTPSGAGAADMANEGDADGDGYMPCAALAVGVPPPADRDGAGDCDDTAAAVHPWAMEICDSLDSDCDTEIVDGFANLDLDAMPDCVDPDIDGDGWEGAADCDDYDATRFPFASEVIEDGIDQDCNGADMVVCRGDLDFDGSGGPTTLLDGDGDCIDPGQAEEYDDCDDDDNRRAPTLPELCDGLDNDCDPSTDSPESDGDADRYLACGPYVDQGQSNSAGQPLIGGEDCDDDDAAFHPLAAESCDNIDHDCDLDLVDGFFNFDGDPEPDCVDADDDGDLSPDVVDCDDFDVTIHPGAVETCDLIDSDCDFDLVDGFPNFDGDSEADCTDPNDDNDPSVDDVDCDDFNATTYPGATESCDLVDSDCDGEYLDGFANNDYDNLPDCSDSDDDNDGAFDVVDCAPFNGAIHPGAAEACDLIDSDCDLSLVDTFANTDVDTLPDCVDPDDDGDGATDLLDCAPLNAARYPGAFESCDSIDSDCDASLVDGYLDTDVDLNPDCVDTNDDNDPTLDVSDCAPLDATRYVGAPELCDSIDSDCDLSLVDGYANQDGDTQPDCVDLNDDNDPYNDTSDCAPLNAAIHPGAVETCNTVDDNCNGVRDDGYTCGTGCYRLDYAGHVYQFCWGYDTNWSVAANFCAARGYYLTMLETNPEHVVVTQYAYAYDYANPWWIGAHDINYEGYYQWISSAYMNYQYWYPGEPNNYGGNEDCVSLLRFSLAPYNAPYHMNDENCGNIMNYVCESW